MDAIENEDFKQYLLRFCNQHEIPPEEAMQHKTVQDVEEYYNTAAKDRIYGL